MYLLREKRRDIEHLDQLVNQQGGPLGLSGISSDVKDLLGQEQKDPRAAEAIELFCYQAKKFLAVLMAVLGGLEVLVFTAGIGENAPAIRWRIRGDLTFLGIRLDRKRNDSNASIISQDDSPVTVRVMKTNEELMIARSVSRLLYSS